MFRDDTSHSPVIDLPSLVVRVRIPTAASVLNHKLAAALFLYAPLATSLGWLLHSWVPWMVGKSFHTGLIGGALCLFWALLAWLGHRVRPWAIVTQAVMGFLFLADTVEMWQERGLCKMSVVLTALTGVTALLMAALAHNLGGPRQGEKLPNGRHV